MTIGRPKHNEYSSNILSIDSSSRQQTAYDKLSDDSFNRTMGILSTDNKRWLELQPGSYSGGLTLNNVNIGVKEAIPNTVSIAGKIRNTANAPCIIGGINSLTKTLTLDSSLGRYNSLQEAIDDVEAGLLGTPSTSNEVNIKLLNGLYTSENASTTSSYVNLSIGESVSGISVNNVSVGNNAEADSTILLQPVYDKLLSSISGNGYMVIKNGDYHVKGNFASDKSGAVTSIVANIVTSETIASTGTLSLWNSDNETETITYSSVENTGAEYTFTVSETLTNTYLEDDVIITDTEQTLTTSATDDRINIISETIVSGLNIV